MSMIMPSFDAFLSLNRTFYGIETIRIHVQLPLQCTVLIVPFMELKHLRLVDVIELQGS